MHRIGGCPDEEEFKDGIIRRLCECPEEVCGPVPVRCDILPNRGEQKSSAVISHQDTE